MRYIAIFVAALITVACQPRASHGHDRVAQQGHVQAPQGQSHAPQDPLYPVQDCSNAMVQMEINQCAEANFESADRVLNETYRKLMDAQTDQAAKDKLRDSERSWIKFRDRDCASQAGPREEGGSIWPMDMANCLEEKTAARLRELKRSLDCPEGMNACAK